MGAERSGEVAAPASPDRPIASRERRLLDTCELLVDGSEALFERVGSFAP